MNTYGFIHRQIDGFFKAGKRYKPPVDEAELKKSRFIAVMLAVFGFLMYAFIAGFNPYLPARIHIRAILYLAPLIGFIVRFWKGISVSWMLRGLRKYWLTTSLLVIMWLVVVQMLYVAFYSGNFGFLGYSGGLLLMIIGFLFAVYYRQKAVLLCCKDVNTKGSFSDLDGGDKIIFLFLHMVSLVFIAFFIGGIIMLLWASGVADWFLESVLSW